ncbi:MAG: hypothetical protein AB199_00365 [Parcubacteria bacterium C7867-004]|nr:MAG: hypothetical protein AB199_00365 [Parcubacteria bacterium C7867-004]
MKQLDAKAVWLFFWGSLLHTLVAAIFIVIWSSFVWLEALFVVDDYFDLPRFALWSVLVFAVLAALTYIWAKYTYYFYRYELTDKGFRKESGIIWKKYVTIPYSRIQNVDINRGILARILGLSDLHIQTAGASASVSRYGTFGAGAEGRLPGVTRADAELLRDELVARASGTTGQGL